MTGCEFGDVILVPFPFTDQSATKKRPAVVVSSAAYHRARIDLIVMPITSSSFNGRRIAVPVVRKGGHDDLRRCDQDDVGVKWR